MIKDENDHVNHDQKKKLLYLCDGQACDENRKKVCWTQHLPPNLSCHHTTDINHSLSKKLKGLLPTKFIPIGDNSNALFEYIDYSYANDEKMKTFFNKMLNKSEDDSNHDQD